MTGLGREGGGQPVDSAWGRALYMGHDAGEVGMSTGDLTR